MRRKGYRGVGCVKRSLSKCEGICRTYDKIQTSFFTGVFPLVFLAFFRIIIVIKDCEDLPMADQILPLNQDINVVVHEIGDLLATAQSNVARQMNNELLSTYWNIGRIIAEYEQTVPERADYGKQTLKELSKH